MTPRSLTFARLAAWSVLLLGLSMGCGPGCGPTPPAVAREMPDADRSSVTVGKPLGVRANGQESVGIQVTVRKKDGTPLAGRTVTVEVSGEGNTVTQPVGPTDEQGVANASVTSTVAGTKTVTAAVRAEGGAVKLAARPTIEFVTLPASRLAFTSAPDSSVAGTALGAFEVSIQNADGETRTGATHLVTVALGSGPAAATLEGTLAVRAVNGVARFPGLVLKKAAQGYTLVASAEGLTGATSPTFTVLPGAPVSLELAQVPALVRAGGVLSPEVSVRDAFGNRATGYTGTLRFSSDDGSAVLPADYSLTAADEGLHVFTGALMLRQAGSRRVTVTDTVYAELTASVDVAVVAGAPGRLVFSKPPVSRSVRDAFDVEVVLTDDFGNRVMDSVSEVSLAVDKGATLAGTVTEVAVEGVASFPGLSIAEDNTGYTLTASASGLLPATSAPFTLTDDKAPAVAVLSQGETTPTHLTVSWVAPGDDGSLGTASSYDLRYSTSPITSDADFNAATPAVVGLPGPAGSAESVTLTGLTPGTTYYVALKVTDNAGNSSRSATLPVSTPYPQASKVVFLVQPESGTAGAALATIKVAIQSADGLVVTNASSAVTLTVQGTTGFGPFTVTADQGVATFDNVRIDQAGTGYTLVASSGGLDTDTSNTFDIVHAAPARLEVVGLTSPVAAGLPGSVTVTVRDDFGNTATGYTGTVRFSSSDAAATLPGDYTFTATDAGRHTFDPVVLSTSGSQTLTVEDLANAILTDTLTVEVSAVAPSKVVLTGLPAEVTAGESVTVTVEVLDGFDNPSADYTGTVRFTSSDGTATLPGDYTFTADDAGRKDFVVRWVTAGSWTLAVQDVAQAFLSASATLRVDPAAPAKLVFGDQPQGGKVRATLAPVTVGITDAHGNAVSVSSPEVQVALVGGNPEAVLGGTVSVAPVGGIATFSDLTVNQQGTDFRLEAVGGTLDGATSEPFTLADDLAPSPAPLSLESQTSVQVSLQWTATGDDGLDGTATSYDLRYSTSPITDDATFASATPVPLDPPAEPGTLELVTVIRLTPSTAYYFALVVKDDAGNVSARSTLSTTTNADPCAGYTCPVPAPVCATDGVSLVTYTSTCVDVDTVATCQESSTSTACPGTDAVCFQGACATAPRPISNELSISEVMHSPTSGTTPYLELVNNTSKLLNLDGLDIEFKNGSGVSGFFTVTRGSVPVVMEGHGTFVLARNKDIGTNGGVSANLAYGTDLNLESSGQLKLSLGSVVLEDLVYTAAFPGTLGKAMSLSSLVVGTKANAHPWYWCDSDSQLPGGDYGTPNAPNSTCGSSAAPPVDSCNVYEPKSLSRLNAGASATITSRFREPGVTDRNVEGNDYYPHVYAELGFGTDSTNPAGWAWVPASFDSAHAAGGLVEDQMRATLSIPSVGTYVYGFRYRFWDPVAGSWSDFTYCDQAGITQPPAGSYGTVLVASAPLSNHVVISEFSVVGPAGANDEFVELYNPTDAEVDLSNWVIQYKAATNTTYNTAAFTFPVGSRIAPRGYFLVTSGSYIGPAGDASWGTTLAFSGTVGHVRLGKPGITTAKVDSLAVDTVGYGSTADSPETSAFLGTQPAGGSFERKATATSTATSMEGGADATRGNGYDSNDNSKDFVLRTARQPQGKASAREIQ